MHLLRLLPYIPLRFGDSLDDGSLSSSSCAACTSNINLTTDMQRRRQYFEMDLAAAVPSVGVAPVAS